MARCSRRARRLSLPDSRAPRTCPCPGLFSFPLQAADELLELLVLEADLVDQLGVDEGATLVPGGPGLPEGVNKGFYVRPTVFADVTNDMTIAREEIFGPVITILGAKDEAEAVKIANDTPYGLAGYVSAGSVESAKRVGRQIRAGNVNLNGVPNERTAPFGGYKQSGNGREWGKFGLEEYLEAKAIAGFNAA